MISATVRYVPAAANVLIAKSVSVMIATVTVAILKDASAKNARTAINAVYAKNADVGHARTRNRVGVPVKYAIIAVSVLYAAHVSAVLMTDVTVRYAEKAAARNV